MVIFSTPPDREVLYNHSPTCVTKAYCTYSDGALRQDTRTLRETQNISCFSAKPGLEFLACSFFPAFYDEYVCSLYIHIFLNYGRADYCRQGEFPRWFTPSCVRRAELYYPLKGPTRENYIRALQSYQTKLDLFVSVSILFLVNFGSFLSPYRRLYLSF